jgi:hypothetical protein
MLQTPPLAKLFDIFRVRLVSAQPFADYSAQMVTLVVTLSFIQARGKSAKVWKARSTHGPRLESELRVRSGRSVSVEQRDCRARATLRGLKEHAWKSTSSRVLTHTKSHQRTSESATFATTMRAAVSP